LNESKTSIFKFYQFWLNVDDQGVEDYLKIYTLLDKVQIEDILGRFKKSPESRLAQKTLAYEVTKIVHGEERTQSVKRVSEVLFGGGDYSKLTAEDFVMLSHELPVVDSKQTLIETLVAAGLVSSNNEARRMIDSGAVYLNGRQVNKEEQTVKPDEFLSGYLIIKRGKNSMALIRQN
jgi:tyrosyl-tRNA synthetase